MGGSGYLIGILLSIGFVVWVLFQSSKFDISGRSDDPDRVSDEEGAVSDSTMEPGSTPEASRSPREPVAEPPGRNPADRS